jgi:hypothetical protein
VKTNWKNKTELTAESSWNFEKNTLWGQFLIFVTKNTNTAASRTSEVGPTLDPFTAGSTWRRNGRLCRLMSKHAWIQKLLTPLLCSENKDTILNPSHTEYISESTGVVVKTLELYSRGARFELQPGQSAILRSSSVSPSECRNSGLTRPQPFPSKSFLVHHSSYHSTLYSSYPVSVAK